MSVEKKSHKEKYKNLHSGA